MESNLIMKQVGSGLALLLDECSSLVGNRESFDAFYKRLQARNVHNPQMSLKRFVELLAELKKTTPKYIANIAQEMQKSYHYSAKQKETMDALMHIGEDAGQPLNPDEIIFLQFLFSLHMRNSENGAYIRPAKSEF